MACNRRNSAIAKMFIAANAIVNLADATGSLPLHYIARCGDVHVAQLLLYAGTDFFCTFSATKRQLSSNCHIITCMLRRTETKCQLRLSRDNRSLTVKTRPIRLRFLTKTRYTNPLLLLPVHTARSLSVRTFCGLYNRIAVSYISHEAKCILVTRVCLSVCVSVCLSLAAFHFPQCSTDPDVSWGNGRACPVVVHYWVDLQLVHGFRCYDNIAPNAKCQPVLCTCFASFCLYVVAVIRDFPISDLIYALADCFYPPYKYAAKSWSLA